MKTQMKTQNQKILDELEEIKNRLISIELALIDEENPEKEDIIAVKEALKEYRYGKTIPFR